MTKVLGFKPSRGTLRALGATPVASTPMSEHPWDNLVAAHEAGDLGDVEFAELALEAGMPVADIERALASARGGEGWDE